MLYDIQPVTGQLPVGVNQYGVFEYLNAYGWPILEPGGRPLDRFILSHDPELQMILATNYVQAEMPACDEGGCNISQTIPAWRSVNFAHASNEGAPSNVLLTHAEVATLAQISGGTPPTAYDYGAPLAPFFPSPAMPAPLQPVGPIITTVEPPPVRLPPLFNEDAPELFPVQTTQNGPGNVAAPGLVAPDFGPIDSGMSGATLLRLGLLAYALTR